jgi:hypothetical protein
MCPADFAIAMKRRHRLDRLRRRRQHPKVEHGRVEFGMSEQSQFTFRQPRLNDRSWPMADRRFGQWNCRSLHSLLRGVVAVLHPSNLRRRPAAHRRH